jgi:serine protease AprX
VALAVSLGALVGGLVAPLPASAVNDGGVPVAAEDPKVIKAQEDLAEAETKAADILAEAQAKADKDLTNATDKFNDKLAKIEEDLAKAAEKGDKELAGAETEAAKDLAKAEAELAKAQSKADEKLAEAQVKADREITKALDKIDEELRKAEERANEAAEELAKVCSHSLGYSSERTVGSMYNINEFIGADEAWEDGYTGQGIDVAVIDTGAVPVEGLDGNKVIYGPDFSLESHHPDAHQLDTYGHGTHIAGIIAGNDYDTETEVLTPGEFQGVAPDARIVSVKVADYSGAVDPSQVIAAIDWVIAHRNDNGMNIRVINLSYGAAGAQPYTIDPLAKAVENAWEAGIVVVAAAGNDGKKTDHLTNPGYDPHIITVSAILDEEAHKKDHCRQDKTKWKTTDYGSHADKKERQPDLYTPGSTVVSLRNPGSFVDQTYPTSALTERFSKATGTSQSTAVVSGAVAVLLEARPDLTPDEVKAILIASADHDKVPVLDIEEALEEPVPDNAAQTWARSSGLGPLDATRGGEYVLLNGHLLTGENTVFGPWTPDEWISSSLTGSSWTGSSWTGSSWTGSSWTGSSWTGSSWTGSSWTGSSWTGSSWTGSSWTGSSWTGSSWTGSSWTGSSWTGSSWH